KMIKVMQAIGELERQWANMKSYPPLPPGLNYIHPGVIVGGPGGGKDGKLTRQPENPGTFPDYCSAEYELKFYPDEDIEKVKEAFEKHLFHLCQLDPWLKEHPPKVTWGLRGIYFPPAQTPATHPIVQTVTQAHRSKGRSVRISGYAAVTDMCWYSSQNVPSVVYGPGEIHLAHSPEESLLIEDLLYATTVYAETILRWCS
ncbi:MAG: M20/M25/M40 family metallo-hydrolase, partial [Candidatus Bathyarchaeia archaeon]